MGLGQRLTQWERQWRQHFNVAPIDAESARRARIYMRWFDHEVLRGVWTNEAEIAPGVFRSNHPTEARFERLAARGIRSIITLRGSGPSAHYWTEQQICARLGLTLYAHGFSDRAPPPKEAVLALIARFNEIDRPFLMHCKSGADRAGLAAAIYLLAIEKRSVAEAKRMLSLRFLHIRTARAGVLDRFIEAYESSGMADFEAWVRDRYDPDALQAGGSI